MNVDLGTVRAQLVRTPGVLDGLLRGLPEHWAGLDEGPGTWSPRGVVAHLSHADRTNWLPRARVLLASGEAEVFPPFDRAGHQAAEAARPLDELLDDFAAVRAESLRALDALNLGPAELARRGTHPEFGPVTLGQLLATWAAHELDHVLQITRTLGGGYREAVGPWRAYLRIMRPA
ncbi:DinB-like domain protein [Deinococcus grandis]|uniref:DinB-like domain protein n=1 Tax=Deinococcus grandis TaxID=57498 RepID=A0A100HH53_9DEIO|nr:DinB family protein [Deinococcus grandis]BBN95868.1 hypothetical protein DEGR_26010 [Deinococcus grandis]GAQ20649.1 DinB-like domain protein [Deinococcus grandis]